MSEMPVAGQLAPALRGPTDQGPFDLAQHAGKPVVVYFYPKDMTPGCTTEARDFRDAAEAFAAIDAVVVGVSRDSVARHAKFRDKESLPFFLVSDEDGTVCADWGVWQEKKLYGKLFMGIVRSTFLIDPTGNVHRAWPSVRVKGHVDDVLEATRQLARRASP